MMHGFALGWLILAFVFVVRPSKRHSDPPESRGQSRIEGDGAIARVFRLASRKQGRITISDVVVDLGISPTDAEDMMDRIVDGIHAQVELSERGRLVYVFPELIGETSTTRLTPPPMGS